MGGSALCAVGCRAWGLWGVFIGGLVQPVAAEELPSTEPPAVVEPLLPEESEPAETPTGEAPEPSDPVGIRCPSPPPTEPPTAPEATPVPTASADAERSVLEGFDPDSAEVLKREEFSQTFKGAGWVEGDAVLGCAVECTGRREVEAGLDRSGGPGGTVRVVGCRWCRDHSAPVAAGVRRAGG